MSSKADTKRFNNTNIKDFTIQLNQLNIDANTEKIDKQKIIQTKCLMNQNRIKLPNISQKKVTEITKYMKKEKYLDDYFIGDCTKNKNLNAIINNCRPKPKPTSKTLNKQSLRYYNYNTGNKSNNRINSYQKYETIDQEIKNKQNLLCVRNHTLENEKRYKISNIKNNFIREAKILNKGNISCGKKIMKLLKENSLTKNNVINNHHENNRFYSNKKDNIHTVSLTLNNNQFKESKCYKTIQVSYNEILDDCQNKFPNIRQINVNYLLNSENKNINESHDIKKQTIKSYREFKRNQDSKGQIANKKIIDSKKKEILPTDNENYKNNFNKFYQYNKNKKSIKYLETVIKNIDNNTRKKLENFVNNLNNEFKNFTDHAYKPLNEALKKINN